MKKEISTVMVFRNVLVNQIDIYLTNWRQFFMRLSCYWSWISS